MPLWIKLFSRTAMVVIAFLSDGLVTAVSVDNFGQKHP
jgi:hypothetical protein